MRFLRTLIAEAEQMLFAPAKTCYLCERPLRPPVLPWPSLIDEVLMSFCPTCLRRIPWVVPPFCERCGRPVAGDEALCPICHSGAETLKGRSLAVYDGVIKRHLDDVSVKVVRELADPLGYLNGVVAEEFVRDWGSFVIVPVPLHSERLVERGFNQADLLAASAARVLRRPVWGDVLERKKATSPQNRLSVSERRINMAGAFAVTRPDRVANGRFLLIDDVHTTGATLSEAAAALMRAGAAEVRFVTVGVAVALKDMLDLPGSGQEENGEKHRKGSGK